MIDSFAFLTVSGLCIGVTVSVAILAVLAVLNIFIEIAK